MPQRRLLGLLLAAATARARIGPPPLVPGRKLHARASRRQLVLASITPPQAQLAARPSGDELLDTALQGLKYFSWALDVGVLREPTNVAAALGTLTVFVGCALAATGAQKPAAARAAAESSSRVADRDSLASSGSAVFDPRDWIEVVAVQAHAAEPPASAAVKADEQST